MKSPHILVWDLPTRAFHWLLVLSFFGAYLTGDADGYRTAHVLFGYAAAGLVAFRLAWGFVGTRWARFSGFVFSPPAAKEIGIVVAEDFKGRPLKDQKAILVEVPMKVPPAINTDYPTRLPLATVPPSLLLKLPTLPEELEYRFLGRHLILRDIKANLIVDFIPDVVPATPAAGAGREAHP